MPLKLYFINGKGVFTGCEKFTRTVLSDKIPGIYVNTAAGKASDTKKTSEVRKSSDEEKALPCALLSENTGKIYRPDLNGCIFIPAAEFSLFGSDKSTTAKKPKSSQIPFLILRKSKLGAKKDSTYKNNNEICETAEIAFPCEPLVCEGSRIRGAFEAKDYIIGLIADLESCEKRLVAAEKRLSALEKLNSGYNLF